MLGETSPAELHRISTHGHIVVASYERPITWAEGKAHEIAWRRDDNVTMTVLVDDRELFGVRDGSVTGSFGVFSITNRGGDFAVRRLTVLGRGDSNRVQNRGYLDADSKRQFASIMLAIA